jgi:hypothetical protein
MRVPACAVRFIPELYLGTLKLRSPYLPWNVAEATLVHQTTGMEQAVPLVKTEPRDLRSWVKENPCDRWMSNHPQKSQMTP